MNAIKYDTSYWKFPELKFLIIFLMTLFPGEEDYGAHCWWEENECSPWSRVSQIQINIPENKQISWSKCWWCHVWQRSHTRKYSIVLTYYCQTRNKTLSIKCFYSAIYRSQSILKASSYPSLRILEPGPACPAPGIRCLISFGCKLSVDLCPARAGPVWLAARTQSSLLIGWLSPSGHSLEPVTPGLTTVTGRLLQVSRVGSLSCCHERDTWQCHDQWATCHVPSRVLSARGKRTMDRAPGSMSPMFSDLIISWQQED